MINLGDFLMQNYKKISYLSSTGVEIPVFIANNFKKRFLGLMGKKEGVYGLLLQPCNSIHTFFMRYPLDALFLDKNNKIIAIKRLLKPFSIVPSVKGAVKVLEFPSFLHASAFLSEGTKIEMFKTIE